MIPDDPNARAYDGSDASRPAGFVELRVLPQGTRWCVRVSDIASYGPELWNGPCLLGCPVQLHGETREGAHIVDVGFDVLGRMLANADTRRKI